MINNIEDLKNNTNKYTIMKLLAEELISLNYTFRDTEKLIQEYSKYFSVPLLIADSNIQGLEKIFHNILDEDSAIKLLNELLEKDARLI